jgi:hypothetical protein
VLLKRKTTNGKGINDLKKRRSSDQKKPFTQSY